MSTYSQAGVDIDAGDLAVQLMKEHLKIARRSEVVGDIGGFAGLFDASALKKFNRPLLATSTDGVGTKTEIARFSENTTLSVKIWSQWSLMT
jgi:phosphoribosylformylglycinamidine cyclo-ligase